MFIVLITWRFQLNDAVPDPIWIYLKHMLLSHALRDHSPKFILLAFATSLIKSCESIIDATAHTFLNLLHLLWYCENGPDRPSERFPDWISLTFLTIYSSTL